MEQTQTKQNQQSAINHRGDTHTLAAMLMNLQRQEQCPGVELTTECELSPRGDEANKTQHNTNKPLSRCEPTSQSADWVGIRAKTHSSRTH